MRIALLAVSLLVAAGAVAYRAHLAGLEAAKEIVSIRNEWAKHGKPVEARPAERGPLHLKTKLSAVAADARSMRAEVPRGTAAKLEPGLRFTECRGAGLSGKVAELSSSPDVTTGLHEVRLELTSSGALKPGSVFSACVRTGTVWGVLRVPLGAVVRDGGGSFVWVTKDGLARKRAVRLGRRNGEAVEISSGLERGELVVVAGLRFLDEGDRVRVR